MFIAEPEGRDSLEGVGVAGRIILKRILKNSDRTLWTGFIWHRTGIGSLGSELRVLSRTPECSRLARHSFKGRAEVC
jgi:hypothetical protein